MPTRLDLVVTHGIFSLDGQDFEVDNNIWLVGDDSEVVVIDAAHQAQPIIDAVAGRNVTAVICTHGHNDHVTVAPELGERLHCPVLLHPGDDVLWKMTHPEEPYWRLDDRQRIGVAGTEIEVIRTPGHSPGFRSWQRSAVVGGRVPCGRSLRARRRAVTGLLALPRPRVRAPRATVAQ